MKGRSALPRTAFLIVLLFMALGTAGAVWGRALLSRVPYFRVRQVEVVGTELLAPDSVLMIASIKRHRSVWDDFSRAQRRLAAHPLIDDAHVTRDGIHSLRLIVKEVEPLALVGLPDLLAVRDDGTILPVDPARTTLDLPVLTAEASLADDSALVAGEAAQTALRVFGRLRALDPGLAAIVSDFDVAGGDGLMAHLVASQPARRLALPARIDEELVTRIRVTLADLRARGLDAKLVEARYEDQVVVRMTRGSRE